MKERIGFTFVGTVVQDVSFDPEEFKGLGLPEITDEVRKTLASVRPDASFFPDDIQLAAEAIANDPATGA